MIVAPAPFGPSLWRRCLVVLVLLLLTAASTAFAQTGTGRNFDHTRTGFVLDGMHSRERCESCHIGGIFRGTPRDCVTCHTGGTLYGRGNTSKSATHIPTREGCESCHNTRSFSGARFTHTSVTPGTCQSCHNGSAATGKSSSHLITSAPCDSCHRIGAWLPAAKFDHAGVQAGSCATCHNGVRATGKPTNHIPYSATAAVGNAACDACHKNGYRSWSPARVHSNFNIGAQCASCHTGGYSLAVGKPNNATHANATVCETCHKATNTWGGSAYVHSAPNAVGTGTCDTCHNGSAARGKSNTHIPVNAATAKCDSCHRSQASFLTAVAMDHAAVTSTACASCHTGTHAPADGKPANHIPYAGISGVGNATCNSCHKAGTSSWTPAGFHGSFSVSAQCASCHTGTFGTTGKPNNATHANATVCETCHKATNTWGGSTYVHSATNAVGSGTCDTCHNGSAARGKSNSHIPVNAAASKCDSCHRSQASFLTAVSMNHAAVTTSACASCHTGTYAPADGKPTNHIPYAGISGVGNATCNSCHKAGTSSWTPAGFHGSFSVSAQCASCHTGTFAPASGKPNNAIHANATTCETCHKTTSTWGGSAFVHSAANAVGSGTCDSCHNGSAARGKTPTHVPVSTGTATCDSCHRSQASFLTAVSMNHGAVSTAACASCHTGGYAPADGKPANHIPYAGVSGVGNASCNSCHKAGTVSWTPASLHTSFSVSAQCATCHTGTYGATGKPNNATHAGVTTCEGCHKTTSSWAANFTHSAANAVGTGTCDTCHNGSAARGKSNTHIPVNAATAKCDSCHRSQASFLTAVSMNHSAVTAATCKSCHSGAYASTGASGKPGNHIPESTQLLNGAAMDCKDCHSATTSWGSVRMNHNNSMGNGAGWCKACHQSGTSFMGNMEKKSLTHERNSPLPTDCSQSGCHRPLGNKGAAYTKWD